MNNDNEKQDPFISFLYFILSSGLLIKAALGIYENEVQANAFTFVSGMPILHDTDAFFYCWLLFAGSLLFFPYKIPGINQQQKFTRHFLYLALAASLLHQVYKWWMR